MVSMPVPGSRFQFHVPDMVSMPVPGYWFQFLVSDIASMPVSGYWFQFWFLTKFPCLDTGSGVWFLTYS